MKNRMNHIACKLTAAVVVFGLTVWLPPRALRSHSCASARAADRPSDALPALQGEKAVEELKERGLYASLQEAMAATRYEISREERPGLRRLPPSYQAPNPLEVEESGAIYPMTIDTLFTQRSTHQQKLTANDGADGDVFGVSVAISGDTVVVGAPGSAAYIFVRNGESWSRPRKLTAGSFAGFGEFGVSVAVSGDAVVVGAPYMDIGSNKDQGSAYVFNRRGVSWSGPQQLLAGDGAAEDGFGCSVAISGDIIVVGAPLDAIRPGSAYIFARNSESWGQQRKITADDGMAEDVFGYSVAISGDTAVVGAMKDDIGSNEDQGSAYIFARNSGAWGQQRKIPSER